MKYCVYSDGETSPYHVGIVDLDRGLVVPFDLGEADARNGILSLITASTMPRLLHDGAVPVGEVRLKAPIPRPRRNIFCVGKNYFEHAHEFAGSGFDSSAAAGAVPKAPIIFSKLPETVIADGAPIRIDTKVSTAIDYEAELAVIIGRGGRGISRASALDHVWGYTIVNDVTARDLQGKHSQWLLGKSQDGFCPMGPWAVSRDELDLGNAGIRCYVNGELRQSSNTSLLIFDVSLLIETISAGITLLPGDIIATGTPAGVGIGFNPPKYLVAGDRVRIEIDNIGTLENPVF
ncbi:MAG: fumarylacetoacetate hydrolase family protein [Rhizobiales bacterium]|nr:fumarylacetoacetate hydrolase family protein [Hyphomicrobiales bacterium]OJU31680.1 MAG: hydrolase [Rhizobiales bacterium 68-8]